MATFSFLRQFFICSAAVLIVFSSSAQSTTIGFWNKEVTLMNTYLLTADLVPKSAIEYSLFWDVSKIVPQGDLKLEAILSDNKNLFVLPVTEEVDKGVRNYKFILARGKAGFSLPKQKDEMGFYMGGVGNQALASIYVDTAKMKTSFACLYLSALNSLIKDGARFSSQNQVSDWLKENYWYEDMPKIHFEAKDLLPPLNDSTTLVSIMPHALVHAHEGYNNDLGKPGREDCFADLAEIREKGGKVSYQVFFFSHTAGLVYHDALNPEDRNSCVFVKKDIHKYGTSFKVGKKM
jgi:hypothetical protein